MSASHLPLPDQDTEYFWAAAAEHRLVCRADADGRPYHYPRARAPGSLSEETHWVELSGRGTVYSFTVVHQAASSAFRDRVPYVLALIDLDEGVRMMSNIDADPATVTIGQRVVVAWREEDEISLPIFVPEPSG